MDLLSTKEVLEKYEIEASILKKIEKSEEINIYKKGRSKYFSEKEINMYINNLTAQELDELKNGKYDERNKLNDLTGKQWIPETKSYFYQKGLGSAHPHAQIEKQHPAPFSYQDILRLIEMFTKRGDTVLDPFLGVGSTLKAAALSERLGTGIELSEKWSSLAKERLDFEVGEGTAQKYNILTGDSREVLKEIERESIDFIVTSPPYWAILNKKADHKVKKTRLSQDLDTNYSSNTLDLGNIDEYPVFLEILTHDIFKE